MGLNLQQTLVIVKPEAFARGIEYLVLEYFAHRGLKTIGLRLHWLSETEASKLYFEHREKSWYPEYVQHMTSGPIFLAVFEAPDAIPLVRTIIGATNPIEAALGTIRGDLVGVGTRNLVHASDSPKSAKREIGIFFKPKNLLRYRRPIDAWEWGLPTESMREE